MNLYFILFFGFVGVAVADPNLLELQRELNDQKQRLDMLEKELRNKDKTEMQSVLSALLTKRAGGVSYEGVAFSATLSQTFDSSGHNKPIPFDSVKINAGNGYSPSTGVFTAPNDGVYMLYTSLSVNGDDALHAELLKNGVTQCQCTSTHYGTGSCMVIIPLSTGDTVLVKDVFGVHVRGSHLSTFNGLMIL
ncbi:heavy metal-binding protein HIP-like [Argopecten irradians]|uniref:heavy metal-binding protein HIP-like n=1 Tax=Argopecten irradians TaxID=31199 RepID=UPI00371B604D